MLNNIFKTMADYALLEPIPTNEYECYRYKYLPPAVKDAIDLADIARLLDELKRNELAISEIIKYLAASNKVLLFKSFVFSIAAHYNLAFDNNILLKIAVVNGCVSTVKYLLDNNTSAAAEDNFAIKVSWNAEITKLLLENGADASVDNNYPICRTVCHRNQLEIIKLLVQYGADVQARDNYPIHMASANLDYGVMEFFLQNGADVHVDNDFSLRTIAKHGNVKFLKLVLEYGANIAALAPKDICKIIWNRNIGIVKGLADHGVDFTVVNNFDVQSRYTKKQRNLGKMIDMLASIGVEHRQLSLIMAWYDDDSSSSDTDDDEDEQ